MRPFLLLAVFAASSALAATERPEDRWNLTDMYPTVAAWQQDASKLESGLKAFAACRGHLGDSTARLKSCLDAYADFTKRYARLETYASELLSEDTGKPESLELQERSRSLGAQHSEATAFLRPEVLKLGRAKIDPLIKGDKSLDIYRHTLDDIVRMAPHTLDAKGEGIVATFELSAGAASNTYRIMSNADMPWPSVKLSDGKEVKLDQSAYTQYRELRNYDIYPPLVESSLKYSLDEAKTMTLEAVKPLGESYAKAMRTGFENRWMDAYPRPRKQSGAHMAGSAYDVHPFVLMNYNDNYESVTTLAHEWGQAMHSYYPNAPQPSVT